MNKKMTFHSTDLLLFFQSLPQWPDIQYIVQHFNKAGYKAWLVGGCLRDALCGITPTDIDFATDALASDIEKLFPKTLSVGKAFGTIIVCGNTQDYEITSFRSDGDYKDGRHPEQITSATPETDAQRRDFTCNGLFFDTLNNKLMDFVEGYKDIVQKQIRAIGIAEERFSEDALRLLRAIRFAAQLNWNIESKTLKAIKVKRSQITLVSIERIKQELSKTLMAPNHQKGLELLESTNLFDAFLKGVDLPCLQWPVITLYGSLNARLAAMTYHWPLKYTKVFFKKIKMSDKNIHWILSLSCLVRDGIENKSLADFRQIVADPHFEDICSLLKTFERKDILNKLSQIKQDYPQLPPHFFSGHDLKAMGFPSGQRLGYMLKALRKAQLNNKVQSKKEALAFLKACQDKT